MTTLVIELDLRGERFNGYDRDAEVARVLQGYVNHIERHGIRQESWRDHNDQYIGQVLLLFNNRGVNHD